MSRIGKKPIDTAGTEVKINGQNVEIKGPKGTLNLDVNSAINIALNDKEIILNPKVEDLKSKALWGLNRTLIANMITGVTKGFEKKMEINGVGFKAAVEKGNLVLSIGYSHTVTIEAPKGIEFKVEKNVITVSGIDKGLVGQISASVRRVKPPEPYKGKGIKYVDEIIKKKLGKKAAATTA